MIQTILVLLMLVIRCFSDIQPCDGTNKVIVSLIPGLLPGEENQYVLNIALNIPVQSDIQLKFDAEANLELSSRASARISSSTADTADINVIEKSPLGIEVRVKGDAYGSVPYLRSLIINTVELCEYTKSGYLDSLSRDRFGNEHPSPPQPDSSSRCGKRKIHHTELIIDGQPTKPGEWPWHVALLLYQGADLHYRCGGILISKTRVLSAAHCVTSENGELYNSEALFVVLGKHNLFGGEKSTQEREILKIIVHENFNKDYFYNDISLIKLKSEAVYTDYVQPVCLWTTSCFDKIDGTIFGTVVGWGYDHTDSISEQMQKAIIPIVSRETCINSNPKFYNKHFTDMNFCAGYANGTSACNGDSGGGFTVFIPDSPGSTKGSYYVRGIVSVSVRKPGTYNCDPNYNVLFTDISKYTDWIARHVN